MIRSYPYELAPLAEGGFLIRFPDVPEALTSADDEIDAAIQAADCLRAALGGYVDGRLPLPTPSPPNGRPVVFLPPLLTAKLSLHEAIREAKVSNVELGRRLGVTEGAVRFLLDLDRASRIDQVAAALTALGLRLVIDVEKAA